MPAYAPGGPGGRGILAVTSEAFFKWGANMNAMKQALSSNVPNELRPSARFFYPTSSAHLSQSDFGILFDWLIRRVLKTEMPPERYIKLNARAILQVLREEGYELSETSPADREEDGSKDALATAAASALNGGDWRILDPNGNVLGWKAIDVENK